MATSPIADNYIENIKNRAFAGYSTAGASNRPIVPNPLDYDDDVNRSYTQFPIGSSGNSSQPASSEQGGGNDILGETFRAVGVPDPRPNEDFPDTIAGYIESKIVDYMGVPTALNPLTGTVRATGVPKAFGIAMPLPMSALAFLGQKASQANLENIQEQAIAGKKGYSVGLLNNAIVGISPGLLGFGTVQSGMYGTAPPGLTQAQHEQNVQAALEAHTSEIAQGQAIPDITGTYNDMTFGSPDGANMGSNFAGVVTSTVANPLGPDFGNVNTAVTNSISIDTPGGYININTPVMSGNPPPGFISGLPSPSIGGQPGGGNFGYGPDPDSDPGFGSGVTGTGEAPVGFDSGAVSTGGIPDSNYGPDPDAQPGNDSSSDPDDNSGRESDDGSYRLGGRIGMKVGGTTVTEGFVNKDPASVSDDMSIADNRYTSVKAGSFVVNQPANEANEKMLDKIVGDATKRTKMKKGGKTDMVDVALSDGERLIEPEVVVDIEKKHGKGFLDKINNAGKPEVKRRQVKYGEKIGAANGGFLADQGMEPSDVGDDVDMQEYIPVSDELKTKLSKFAAKKPQRGQIKSFIKSLSPEDKLTVLFLTETTSNVDPIESMEAIGEVVKNRMNSDYYDFKGIKTLDDALLKQTSRGAFHFSGLEPKNFWPRTKDVKKGLANKGLAKAYAAAQNTLDPETEGESRLPANTLFYTRKDAPSQWMRESKDLEFSTELGGHEFYRTFAAREFP